jgi:hypothetical protein
MLPLWFQILLAIVGLGVPKAILDRYLSKHLSELTRWVISIIILIGFVATANIYVQRQHKPRHLTQADCERLTLAFSEMKSSFPQLTVGAAAGDGEANGYAKEFVDTFNQIGIKTAGPTIVFPESANAAGISVVVRDLSHPPQLAELFAEGLLNAQFKVIGANMATLGPNHFMLVIGSRPQ